MSFSDSVLAKRTHISRCELLAYKASRTFSYLADGFRDPDAIKFFDAQALSDIPLAAQSYLANLTQKDNFYTSTAGEPELLEALSKLAASKNLGFCAEPNILITAGAVNAFSAICYSICDQDDIILALTPSYVLFANSVKMFGAEMVPVPCKRKEKFQVDPAELENMILDLKSKNRVIKALFIINPTNIDGACYTSDQVKTIGQIARKHNLMIIEDRVYDQLQFDQAEDAQFFGSDPSIRDLVVTVDSVSKRYGATQWRVGWLYGPEWLIETARMFVMQSVWSPKSSFQKATAFLVNSALDSEDNEVKEYIVNLKKEYKYRRDLTLLLINGVERYQALQKVNLTTIEQLLFKFPLCKDYPELIQEGVPDISTPIIPEAGMFLLLKFSDKILSAFRYGSTEYDLKMAREIYQRTQIVMLPPSELTLPEDDPFFRIEYGIEVKDLFEAFSRLKSLLKTVDHERGEILATGAGSQTNNLTSCFC